jgi:hypothetical protein
MKTSLPWAMTIVAVYDVVYQMARAIVTGHGTRQKSRWKRIRKRKMTSRKFYAPSFTGRKVKFKSVQKKRSPSSLAFRWLHLPVRPTTPQCISTVKSQHGEDETLQYPALSNEVNMVSYDTDSYWIGVDTMSTYCITNCLDDYSIEPTKISRKVRGISKEQPTSSM